MNKEKRSNISNFGIRITFLNLFIGVISILLAYYFSNKYPKTIITTGLNGQSVIETVPNPLIVWGILGGAFILIVLFAIGAEIIELLHRIELSNRYISVFLKETQINDEKNN